MNNLKNLLCTFLKNIDYNKKYIVINTNTITMQEIYKDKPIWDNLYDYVNKNQNKKTFNWPRI